MQFLAKGNGHQISNRRKALSFAADQLPGLIVIDDSTVDFPPYGRCRFSAFTHDKGAMISTPNRDDNAFGDIGWHELGRIMLFRDAGGGTCIVYVCPIEPLFSKRTIGRHGVTWANIATAAEFEEAFDARSDGTMEIIWTNPDSRDYVDCIPNWVWTKSGGGEVLEHLVKGPKGGTYRARCDVAKSDQAIDLTYPDTDPVNEANGWYPGTTRIVLDASGRPTQVLWKDPGGVFEDLRPTLLIVRDLAGEEARSKLESDLEAIEADWALSPTQRATLVNARLGQGKFRSDIERCWDFRCALTGISMREVLRASHIKPWSESTDGERTDSDNGLLLAAHVDALFDRRLISFEDDGTLTWSRVVPEGERLALRLPGRLRKALAGRQAKYMAGHRGRLKGN